MITYQTHSAIRTTESVSEQQSLAQTKRANTAAQEQDYVAAANIAAQSSPVLDNKADDPYKYEVVERNQSFLEKMREAVMFSRLGANKEKIDELKEKMAELEKLAAEGKISPEELEERMAALQEAMREAVTQEENKANKDTLMS
ncbi:MULTISPECIES: hypothetical protein [Pseudoalteromonas]|uniref:Uncharacterized protein n=1 Tax=Pseudoalteromonas maricaloris TaxID=184924 RepID=A0A8I2H286_9GAMM|nr:MULTISPECIES: hypothetical protein [Pseudoalteromonas]KID32946.1 hypothetical protein QT15_21060 [Pseudoalteromonas flavipulchra NCIMB 2033 = ATCC BAA-314]MBD0781106.1 hypothetical protein [Pseudoalteromonas flavipulchra]MBE0373535.1 hypothetical protein [Pseudoalteromonas flavipulchra NCIMB 2033 = ATCC BAA-314]NLR19949.1 hypothetical protein [Pseudoalteromonas maricaloris]RZG07680.1 hypothetical protein EXT48_04945 [Pseudoalteromonas sp. CO348]